MEIQSHFKNIRKKISSELNAATKNITAAIAWMTDPILFEDLLTVARRGVKVRLVLLNDEINARSGLNMERLRALGSEIHLLPPAEGAVGGLHHKFCVIDRDVVITGSYNWTRRASTADENILIVRGELSLAAGYEDAFDELLRKYRISAKAPKEDVAQLRLRLTVILNLLQLGDHESLPPQIAKLESEERQPEIDRLITFLRRHQFGDAETLLIDLMARATSIIPRDSIEIVSLKLELKTLEAQSIAMATEQAEMEKTMAEFSHRHLMELGDVLEELLELRIEWRRRRAATTGAADDRNAHYQAEKEREAWRSTRQAIEHGPVPRILNADEQKDLKRLFREASMLCHPDRVSEADREEAAAVFIRLREAYQKGDIAEVRKIHVQLRTGRPFADLSDKLNEIEQLRRQVSRLRIEVDRLVCEINKLRSSETWCTIESIDDWNQWFKSARVRIIAECSTLRKKLENQDD